MTPEPVVNVTNKDVAKRLREVAGFLDTSPSTQVTVDVELKTPFAGLNAEQNLEERWNVTTLRMRTTP